MLSAGSLFYLAVLASVRAALDTAIVWVAARVYL